MIIRLVHVYEVDGKQFPTVNQAIIDKRTQLAELLGYTLYDSEEE